MEPYTEDKVRGFTHNELVSALVTCATIYGREMQGYLKAPVTGVAGQNACLCQDEVIKRLKLIPEAA